MPGRFVNRLLFTITNTPGTSGALIVGPAASVSGDAPYRTLSAADDGATFDGIVIRQGTTAWEQRDGCVYTHSTTTLTRGTLVDSSAGAINLTSAATVTQSLSGSGVATLRGAGNYVGTRVLTATMQGAFGLSSTAYTWSLQAALPKPFVAVRMVIFNCVTSAVTGITGAASVGGTASDRVNNSGAWVGLTWAGASSVTLPAAPSLQDPTIVVSDWAPIASVARSDGGTLPLIYLRCYTPGSNASVPLNGLGLDVSGWASIADGNLWAWRFQAGDFVTTPSGMTSSADPSGSVIAGLQFLTASGAISSPAFFGDSITSAYLATIPGNAWANIAAAGVGAVPANLGWAGQTHAQILARALRYIPVIRPPQAWFPAYSPNDGASTAAITNTQLSNVLRFVDCCRQNGTQPIVWTGLPRTTNASNSTSFYTSGQDDLRIALNAAAKAAGFLVCDFASVMSDGTGYKWVSSSVSVDGLHPNDAGNTLMAAEASKFCGR